MSRCDTIKTIAFFVIVVLIGVLMAICLIQYGNSINIPDENTPQLTPNSSVQRTPGLLVVSHGEEIIPEKGTAVVAKMEQIAEENYRYSLGISSVNVVDCGKMGTVLTMRYDIPTQITWTNIGNVTAEKIMITIPDNPDWKKRLSYFVVVYSEPISEEYNSDVYVLEMTIEQANELLELAGLSHRVT